YCVFLGATPISWKTKKKTAVARSSAEAEYRSMAAAVCKLTWIMYLLNDFGVSVDTPVPFLCDNQAALHITAIPVFHERTKHLEIDYHIIRNKYKEGIIQPNYVISKQQIVDIFTKREVLLSFIYVPNWLGF
ncbi:UNVERIFIED_CONTAM: hypothetical protein Sindi_1866900, partial [Sesamum indicum]